MPFGGFYDYAWGRRDRKQAPKNGPVQRTRKGKVKRGK